MSRHEDPPTYAATVAAAVPNDTLASVMRDFVSELRRQNPSELDRAGLTPEQQAPLLARQPGRRCRVVALVGEDGSRMNGVVEEHPAMPNGRVTRFENYCYPKGILTPESQGGLVPDGMEIARDRNQGFSIQALVAAGKEGEADYTMTSFPYTQWKCEFWRKDHARMIGKELKAHWCDPEGLGLKTPWEAATA
jgi:hypothetical protein